MPELREAERRKRNLRDWRPSNVIRATAAAAEKKVEANKKQRGTATQIQRKKKTPDLNVLSRVSSVTHFSSFDVRRE
ncbi:hypothetical protein L596_010900 [Steinernema carpocapsae]|uniref:Uncharacterized protein n=1 Tax=Steinernema carpocapsae TaxID=34508 RepID=A0A4U5PJV6_STECR|nr:hypothetical protein L596_010900 [Steinernema carpocapsae]